MSERRPTPQELLAAAIAQIHIGIAMAKSRGVVCGFPTNIRITRTKPHE